MNTQKKWTSDEDLIVAEVVLRHVREGSTATKAFMELSNTLNKKTTTVLARWNDVLRHQYLQALEIAKKQGSKLKKTNIKNNTVKLMLPVISTENDDHVLKSMNNKVNTMEEVIDFLQTVKVNNPVLEKENTKLKKENEELKQQLSQYKEMEETYQQMMAFVKSINSK